MRVLVTGSQGFIGSYLCQELLARGYTVTGIDNYSKYGHVERPHDSHPRFKLLRGDAKYLQGMAHDIGACDYIVAGAAMIGGISYFTSKAYDLLAENERLTASVFDFALKQFKQGHLKRLVVISSSMVFESTAEWPTPEGAQRRCPPPLSTYGFQKLATEYFAQGAREQYGLPSTIIRPFNCVGVGEEEAIGASAIPGNTKMLLSHVLPDFISRALDKGPNDEFEIYGSGRQVRHYTNGRDIARGIRLAMELCAAENEDFNISNDRPVTVEELAEMVWDRLHKTPINIKYLPGFPYDVQFRSPDVSKAERLLGFKATIPVEESVDEVIEWMKKSRRTPVLAS